MTPDEQQPKKNDRKGGTPARSSTFPDEVELVVEAKQELEEGCQARKSETSLWLACTRPMCCNSMRRVCCSDENEGFCLWEWVS
jgi:hypothetical protein